MNKHKQDKGLRRNIIDKFYTKPSVVNICLDIIKQHININKTEDLIIEPSAGNGSFNEIIKSLCNNYKLFDIEPDNNTITKQDFLTLDYSKFQYKNIHIIGNPPFGRQSSMAIKFLKYAALFSHSISFILPKSFKKNSMKTKVPLQFHCIYEGELPEKSFLVNNKEYDVPCIFQIWEKKEVARKLIDKLYPTKYMFVKRENSPDISFRRVGVNAGTIYTDCVNKSDQSHYFIKFNENIFTSDLYNKLKNVVFENSDDTVGPKSISKQELIKEFNKIIL